MNTRTISLLILWTCVVAGCMELQARTMERATESHNAAGGYYESCGELPGLVGDDC